MHRLKSRGIITLAVIGLFAFSGIAMADTEDDTVFNYGADDEFFFWNVTSLEFESGDEQTLGELSEECSLNGSTEYEYSVVDGSITLTDTTTGEDVELGECGELLGGDVTGPEGQVNHGMYLKLFNELYEGGPNRGCLVRHIAQSSLGIENQVTVEEAAELEIQFDGEGEVTFESAQTNCIHGNPFAGDDAEAEGVGGPPQEVLDRFEDGTPGKPADVGGGRP